MLNCDDESLKNNTKSVPAILVVEDSALINNLVYNKFTECGYECEQAFDFAQAQALLHQYYFDFIILDLNLPDAFGEDLVEEVFALSSAKHDTKIIILTSETDIQSRENLFKIGILDYVLKDHFFENSLRSILHTITQLEKNRDATILIIDDSKMVTRHIEKVLHVRNYKTLSAINAKEAFEVLETRSFNLIVLDMELPDIHGLEFLQKIRLQERFDLLPIIAISGSNDAETVRKALKLGAGDYIKKPFNVEEFTLKIDRAVLMQKQSKEVLCKQQILNDYKEAVDRSTIVSKTDKRGIITYVNDKFCEISGYSQEELIGKPHNMIRHPDMAPQLFEELWETIKQKKSWTGIIKNLKKNGETFYMDTVINPIIDYHGEIVEYIGIRIDITEVEMMKEEMNRELNITKGNFAEMYKRSLEYEKAIDESNILSRTDIHGKITYVNQAFCDISGYSKEELMRSSHNIVRDPAADPKMFQQLWNTIGKGRVWKGSFKNRKKNGEAYYVSTSIVPIMDDNGSIVEYMGIRHDVTEIVMLHKELEDTQKEIIQKIGEVGETRSKETGYHVKRVAEYSRLLALLAGLGKKNAQLLYYASPMHDIGKIGIPDSILKKAGKLDEDEFKVMRTHAEIGYHILKGSKREILKAAAIVAYRHHERWDGTGYPNALLGEQIHIFGRITTIADVFDALGSKRVYKEAWELEKILEYFKEQRGKHFDPKLIDIFFNNLDKFLKIRDRFKDVV